jgi:hypothetical protein
MPLQLRDKSDFYSEIDHKRQYLQVKSVQHLFFLLQSIGVSAYIQTLGHLFPKLKSPMVDQNQAAQVNLIPLKSIRHYPFRLLPQISSSAFP